MGIFESQIIIALPCFVSCGIMSSIYRTLQDGEYMDCISLHSDMLRISELFEPCHTMAWPLLSRLTWPWEALSDISGYIAEVGASLDMRDYKKIRDSVWIHKTASVAASAFIGDSVIIGARTEVRHCAFIRGSALIGDGAVTGNSTELENVILFDEVQAPHYNYIGDSILGYKSHMGAGSITSNVKSDRSLVSVTCGDHRVDTGLKKFGAIIGDHVEIGCNTVLNPGCVVGTHATVYPLSMVRGFVPPRGIYKRRGEIVEKR